MADEPKMYWPLSAESLGDYQFELYGDISTDRLWLGDVLTTSERWVSTSVGPVDAALIARLEEHGYEQAPALVLLGAALRHRLVSTKRLRELLEQGEELLPNEENFLANDALVLDDLFVDICELFDEMSKRTAAIVCAARPGFVAGLKGAIPEFGLLTIADLDSRPVRRALYDLLVHLETLIAERIDDAHLASDQWLDWLGEEAQARILGRWELAKRRNIATRALAGAELADLLTLVERSPHLQGVRKTLMKRRRHIADLRNRVMHPVRPLVLSREDVQDVATTLWAVRDAISRLRPTHDRPTASDDEQAGSV